VGRLGLRLVALGLLLTGGLAAALLAVGPRALASGTTGSTTTGTSATTTSAAPAALVVTGHGWGHGLGLAQWGTYGYAKHGWTYDAILAHYYSGTTLGAAPVSTVRVLLASGRRVTLSAPAGATVTDASGTTVQLDPGTIAVVKADLAINGTQLTSPLTVRSTQPLGVATTPYRGRLVVSSDGKALQVVDVVGLESYVKGVVAAEMPSGWPGEALKAQAVASRSYALANLAHGRGFDLYSDSRSQVYGGVAAETAATNAAVDATRRQVVLYGGKVADTLFSASSGGRTASAAESTGTAVPYLVSVPDPYDTASPYHDWGPVVLDLAKVAKLLKLGAPIADLQTTPGTSGRVKTATVLANDESTVTVTGNQLRTALGLRSTWFTPALLALQRPAQPVTYGGAATLTGFARGVTGTVSLESKPAGGTWAPVGDLVPDGNGGLSTIVSPQLTTQYRLVWGTVHAALARVSVAPRVDAQASVAGAQGAVAPAQAGAPVELQLESGTMWTTVASTATDDSGAWSFAQPLGPGTYRVRCTPGHGLVPGVSAVLAVQ
jgi:stage II sporulation protein D